MDNTAIAKFVLCQLFILLFIYLLFFWENAGIAAVIEALEWYKYAE